MRRSKDKQFVLVIFKLIVEKRVYFIDSIIVETIEIHFSAISYCCDACSIMLLIERLKRLKAKSKATQLRLQNTQNKNQERADRYVNWKGIIVDKLFMLVFRKE